MMLTALQLIVLVVETTQTEMIQILICGSKAELYGTR